MGGQSILKFKCFFLRLIRGWYHIYRCFYIQFWNVLQTYFFHVRLLLFPKEDHFNIIMACLTYVIKARFLTSLFFVRTPLTKIQLPQTKQNKTNKYKTLHLWLIGVMRWWVLSHCLRLRYKFWLINAKLRLSMFFFCLIWKLELCNMTPSYKKSISDVSLS